MHGQGSTSVDARFEQHLASFIGAESYADWKQDSYNAADWQVGACQTFAMPVLLSAAKWLFAKDMDSPIFKMLNFLGSAKDTKKVLYQDVRRCFTCCYVLLLLYGRMPSNVGMLLIMLLATACSAATLMEQARVVYPLVAA